MTANCLVCNIEDTITQCGNKTFPRWEYIRCYSIAQADKLS